MLLHLVRHGKYVIKAVIAAEIQLSSVTCFPIINMYKGCLLLCLYMVSHIICRSAFKVSYGKVIFILLNRCPVRKNAPAKLVRLNSSFFPHIAQVLPEIRSPSHKQTFSNACLQNVFHQNLSSLPGQNGCIVIFIVDQLHIFRYFMDQFSLSGQYKQRNLIFFRTQYSEQIKHGAFCSAVSKCINYK